MRRTIHGCGSRTGSRVRSMRYACSSSKRRAPWYGLVSTAKRSGGRRRHHSHSNDWIPPILGGKSLVTRRCFTPACAGRAGPLAQRACSARTSSSCVAVAGERRRRPRGSPRVGGVAEHDEGVAPQPARVAAGDVPAAVSLEQRVVVGVEQVEHVDPGLGAGGERARGGAGRGARSAGRPPGSRRSRRCDRRWPRATARGSSPGRCSTQARQRLASMTPGATMAPVGQASRQRRHVPQPSGTGSGDGQLGGRDDAAEDEPAAGAGQQDVGVLAEPPEPGEVGDLAVDDRVVVGEGDGAVPRPPAAGGPSPAGRCATARSGRPRRSGRRAPGHPPGRGGLAVGEVGAAADDDRPGARHGPVGIGRAVGVAVGEPHPGVETGAAAIVQRLPCPLEHARRRHAEVLDAVLAPDLAQVADGRHGLGATHGPSVRREGFT